MTEFHWIGPRVRTARKRRKLSLENLATLTGYHRNTLGRVERGECLPSLQLLADIADALNAPIIDLICPERHELPGANKSGAGALAEVRVQLRGLARQLRDIESSIARIPSGEPGA